MFDSEQLAALSHLHRRFESEGVAYWLFGGWAVDFHAGALTRPHGDLDLAIWLRDFPRVAQLLEHDGWTREEGAQDGSAAFMRGDVSLEPAFLQRDDAHSEPYTPLGRAAGRLGRRGLRPGCADACGASVPESSPWPRCGKRRPAHTTTRSPRRRTARTPQFSRG